MLCWIPCVTWFFHAQHRFSAFWLRSKCSICTYQVNIWYGRHVPPSILNWLNWRGWGSGAWSGPVTGWPGIAVPPGSAHFPTKTKRSSPSPQHIHTTFQHKKGTHARKFDVALQVDSTQYMSDTGSLRFHVNALLWPDFDLNPNVFNLSFICCVKMTLVYSWGALGWRYLMDHHRENYIFGI